MALLIAMNCCYSISGGALRRTPKVYNALITTDENLSSSRAFPVIQPSIHEGGVAHYPYGYSPYSIYSPPVVRFGQPIVPGFEQKSHSPSYPFPHAQFPPQYMPQASAGGPLFYPGMPYAPDSGLGQTTAPQMPQESAPQSGKTPPTAQNEIEQPVNPPTPNLPRPQKMPNEQLPIPLNEYGIPQSLIPLLQYNNHFRSPAGLQPFPYQQFPPAYDPITGYREEYLPPFSYFPGHSFAVGPGFPPKFPPKMQQEFPTPPNTPLSPTPPSDIEDATDDNDIFMSTEGSSFTTESNFENIKNGSKSKGKNVPDVPPPPIPSGAKSKQT